MRDILPILGVTMFILVIGIPLMMIAIFPVTIVIVILAAQFHLATQLPVIVTVIFISDFSREVTFAYLVYATISVPPTIWDMWKNRERQRFFNELREDHREGT